MGDKGDYELRFRVGQAGAEQLQRAVDDALEQLRAQVDDGGQPGGDWDRAELADLRVRASESEQGVEPLLTAVVIAFAGKAGKRLADRLWEEVLEPAIKRKLGGKALGERIEPEQDGQTSPGGAEQTPARHDE